MPQLLPRRSGYTFIGADPPPVYTRRINQRHLIVIAIAFFCLFAVVGLLIQVMLDHRGYNVSHNTMPLGNLTPSDINDTTLNFVSLGSSEKFNTKATSLPLIEDKDIMDALVKGQEELEEMDHLNNILVKEGITLTKDNPGFYHYSLSNRKHSTAKNLTRTALLLEKTSLHLKKKFLLNTTQTLEDLPLIDMRRYNVSFPKLICDTESKYRTLDGTCNNKRYPQWGKANTAFTRLLPPDYGDGLSTARLSSTGELLPSARLVSTKVHSFKMDPDHKASHLMMAWGQFVDHDITKTATAKANGFSISCCDERVRQNPSFLHSECLPIDIPSNDSYYSIFEVECMEFLRSDPAPRDNCTLGPREQMNLITSFIDGSAVYGSSIEEMMTLRSFKNGTLKIHEVNGDEMLPLNLNGSCSLPSENKFCYRAGDSRSNEQIILTVLHTVWLREHNRIVKQLTEINPHWDDEKLFQEGRRIVGALLQHITYNEFLPPLLGPEVFKTFGMTLLKTGYYTKYDSNTNPTISNAFSAAAFRFGHSMVQSLVELRAYKNLELRQMHKLLFYPFHLEEVGYLDMVLRGAMYQPAKRPSRLITSQLTNHLFQSEASKYGFDLEAITVQRGRDHGIPGYNKWRKYCGLKTFSTFSELSDVMDNETVTIFQSLYRSVDDIDLHSAALSEKALKHAMLGPIMTCIIAEQFSRLRRGDRFWYENGGQLHSFTSDQLQEIRKGSLARILCDNTRITSVTRNPLLQHSIHNPLIPCNSSQLQIVDLTHWNERTKA